ncbi:U3 small nucleolar RNA-associated protein 14 homolog A [Nematostella vectensis]|uniref:U3 small nucleolar RNA-associated protein 14 homolog A n=1 Tax=Nematostella vectensis TaxID=45351 RepID=UPI002076E2C5|nr:U3 small nucleolar RNA-associated protein 14 homolog A [Nematostella vectensis]
MATKEALKLLAPKSFASQDYHGVKNQASSSSESESEDEGSKRQNVIKAIENLDKKKRKRQLRSEPSQQVSEFNLASNTETDKVDVSDLVGLLPKSSTYGRLKKKLASMEKSASPMDLPLQKPQAEKIQRTVAYDETKTDITKWQPIVKKNREAEHLTFPLNPYKPAEITTKTLAVTFKPRTPLEEEVAAILRGSFKVIERENKELTEEEEQALLAMDLEEAKERRRELQRMRALQSYYEEKCRRAKKIKSKKYHRVKKRAEKRAAGKQNLEELQKSDPDKARQELEKLERARAEERVSLKHRNTSKWAKSLLVHGNKDPEARKALHDQMLLSRQLTEKHQQESDSEDYEEPDPDQHDVTSDGFGGLVTSGDNPWSIDKTGDQVRSGVDPDEPEPITKLQRLQPIKDENNRDIEGEGDSSEGEKDDDDDFELQLAKPEPEGKKGTKRGKKKTSKDATEESEAPNKKRKEKKKKKKKKKASSKIEPTETAETDDVTERAGLLLGNDAIDEDDDDDRDSKEDDAEDARQETARRNAKTLDLNKSNPLNNGVTIDPKKIFRIEDTGDSTGGDESRGQILSIQQAFANDDVIEEFAREKDQAIDSSKPKDLDLTLPGWGDWGGAGVKVSEKKKAKFMIRAEPGPDRKDKNLAHVIINEERNRKFARNQVKTAPHPYRSRTQFERSIRNPVGKHWNTANTVKELTKPRVEIQMGAIIEPITAPKQFKRRAIMDGPLGVKKRGAVKGGDGDSLVIHA